MQYVFHAQLEPSSAGGFVVTFPDVPEAICSGDTRSEAVRRAADALGIALRWRLADNEPLPEPKATDGTPIAVDPADAIKIALITRFNDSGLSKREFARRLGKAENEIRRMLDPDHPTKIGAMQEALRNLGQTIIVSIENAA